MGAIWVRGAGFVGAISELIGYKLGIVVSDDDLRRALTNAGMADAWPDDLDATYRYRSEAYEGITKALLEAFGDPDAATVSPAPGFDIVRSLPESERPDAMAALNSTLELFSPLIGTTSPGTPIDPTPVLDEVERRHGRRGRALAVRLLGSLNASLYVSPWARVRRAEWPDLVVLSDLFAKEATTASLGRFFDQRFVDYLDANFGDVDSMNWRRFEALVGEYLSRIGCEVELGPGRNDDGVDIRAWLPDADRTGPATIIVQCKRQDRKIDKAVIKALAADVHWNGADVGLLVTTTTWSPGAQAVAETRDYPVLEVNRDAVRLWVRGMRTPGAGTWLA